MISKSILHRLFITRAGSIYRSTPKVTSCSLCLTDSLMNNWFVVQPVNWIPNPSQANERVGPLVQDLESVLKGTSHSPSLTPKMGGLLSWRTRATLTRANLRIISNKHEYMVSSGLKWSYLGNRMKRKSVSTVNDIIKWEWFSSWSDLMQYYCIGRPHSHVSACTI